MATKDTAGGRGINTQLAHSGNDPHEFHGWVNPPVVHGSTVLFPDAATMKSGDQRYTYGTHATPTTDALTDAIDELEGSAGTVLSPSGLTAILVPMLAFASAGDHVLIVDTVYFPTRRLANNVLTRMGIEVEYYPPEIGEGIFELFRDNTTVLFLESPGSNTFEMQDIPTMAERARAHGIVTMLDNSWATPVFFRPMDHGINISIQAATKYLGGHSDVLMGMTSADADHWERLHRTRTELGICAAPDDAFLVLRGLRTMGIRLERHQKTTLAIARWLEALWQDGDTIVGPVLHPALESFPGHDIWKRDFRGASGIFSFVLKDATEAQAHAFMDALELFGLGYSWGGYESLVTHVYLKDRTVSARDYGGQIMRLQIGLEDEDDLRADIAQALEAAKAAG